MLTQYLRILVRKGWRSVGVMVVLCIGTCVIILLLPPDPTRPFLPYLVAGAGLFIGLLAVLLSGSLLYFSAYPYRHPACRRMRRFGSARTLIPLLDRDLEQARVIGGSDPSWFNLQDYWHEEKLLLSPSWVVHLGPLGVQLAPLDQVVWVRGRGSEFLPPPRTKIEVGLRQGPEVAFLVRSADAERLLFELRLRLPWIPWGLEQQWETEWQTDRAHFITAVDQCRQEHLQSAPREDENGIRS
jgi:hypothetical protein